MKSTNRPVIFGEWLKIRRKGLDLTQVELAERAGCSVHALRKIESGERRPSKQLARLLANSLEIPSEEQTAFVRVARGELNLERLPAQYLASYAAYPPTPKSPVAPSNLPIPPTQLIGREQELVAIKQLLQDSECRMLTFVGPGGIGKTHLAIEAAVENKKYFPDGVFFVSFASINSPTFIVPAIASGLGIVFQGQIEPRIQLLNYLQAKKVLILLDNVEHLLDGIEIFAEILERAPMLKLLVTSREHLNLQGEWVFHIQGLPVPPGNIVQNPDDYSSIALFLQSARRKEANFIFQEDDLQSIIRICQALEGMPLGIELAATWVSVLSCGEIAREVERSLDFLATSMRDVPERQRSLRAVFDHSWNLISEDERKTLQRLAVFQGCFTRKAAEQIVGANLHLLMGLVSKSLVRRTENGCYDLHDVIRQYAHEHLLKDPQKDYIYNRHSEYYLAFLSEQEKELKGYAQREAIQELTDEIDNLHAAWSWAINQNRFEIIGSALRSFCALCDIRGWLNEGINYLDLVIQELRAHPDFENQPRILGQALAQQGLLYFRQGKFHHAQSILEESISILTPIGDCDLLADPLITSGIIFFLNGEIGNAQTRIDESLACARAARNPSFEAYAIYNKGYVSSLRGHYNEAYEQMLTGLEMWQALGDPHLTAQGLNFISPTAIKLGYYDRAQEFLGESLKLCTQIGDRWGLGIVYRHLGLLALAQGNLTEAKSNIQKSLEIFAEFITGWDIARSMFYLGEIAFTAGDLPEAERIYLQALPITMEAKARPLALDILVGLADFYSRTSKYEQAIKISKYVMSHDASTFEAKDRAARVVHEVETQLTVQQLKHIGEWAKNQSLEKIIGEVLGEEYPSS